MGMQGIIPPNINYNKNISDGYQIRPYTAGETCIHNNTLYKAKQDITVAEDWNPDHWKETTVEQELSAVNTKIANITPDDTAVDGKPWTSKHIVDMLCPPLKVSGNPVQCYPVAGYPLGIEASWEPTQEGTGDPSLDNIRPIKGRDSVEVERCGENLILFPYSSGIQEKNGLVIEPQQNGSIVVNGTALETTFYIFEKNLEKRVPLNTVMALSGCPVGGDLKNGYYIGLYMSGRWSTDSGVGNTNVICNSRNISSRIEITIVKGTVCDNLIFWPKLEIGDKIAPYCKYQGDTTTLALPETIYGGSVDAVSGEGEEKWGLLTLTGEESWVEYKNSNYNGYAAGLLQAPYGYNTERICSHYKKTELFVGADNELVYFLNVANDADKSTVSLWKKWLADQYAAGTPVQIAYKLNAPTSFLSTGNAPVKAISGVNTVLTDADTAEVTGREDLIHAISGQ